MNPQDKPARLALGADKGSIYTLVLRDGLMLIALGAVAGVVAAFAMARVIDSLLFEVSPYDPLVTGAAITVLMVVGVLACVLAGAAGRGDRSHGGIEERVARSVLARPPHRCMLGRCFDVGENYRKIFSFIPRLVHRQCTRCKWDTANWSYCRHVGHLIN